jgi:carbon-monoxide dehydrogenase large subunit
VVSNTASTAPYRSAGRPEAMYIMERLIDRAARELGIDPIELRRRNLVPESAMPYKNPLGLTYDSGAFGRAMETAVAMGDWAGFPARRAEAKRRGKLRGIGVANYIEVTSGFPLERTEITVHPDHRVDVVIGTTSSGQGHETSFAQCVADWLGVPFESIRLITGDTDIVKEGGGSHSARSMRMAGIVMGKASEAIIEKGRQIAAYMMEAAASDIGFARGRFSIKGTDRSVGIFDVAAAAATRADLPAELKGRFGADHQELMKVPGFPYGAQVCEVEIDPDTGTLEIIRIAAVDDVGRAINPLILHGQTHGGIVQAAGQALCEHAYYDPATGQMLAGSFMDYAMPRADMFPSFATEIMEVPTPTNALGVRGGGEGGATPVLAVIVNAVVDALAEFGVTHFDMPLTAERIWRAIDDGRRAGSTTS